MIALERVAVREKTNTKSMRLVRKYAIVSSRTVRSTSALPATAFAIRHGQRTRLRMADQSVSSPTGRKLFASCVRLARHCSGRSGIGQQSASPVQERQGFGRTTCLPRRPRSMLRPSLPHRPAAMGMNAQPIGFNLLLLDVVRAVPDECPGHPRIMAAWMSTPSANDMARSSCEPTFTLSRLS